MFRFLFTTGTGTGHVNPVLPVVRTLVERGHEVVWITGRAYEAKVEAKGLFKQAEPLFKRQMSKAFEGSFVTLKSLLENES